MKKTASQSQTDTDIQAHTDLSTEQSKQDSTVVELALKAENRIAIESGQNISIKEAVTNNLKRYFDDLGAQDASQLYQMVINEVEPALLKEVMAHTQGNQSKASEILGLNRGTLRKKLKQYHLD
jgi:Fis family transcriptional regulator